MDEANSRIALVRQLLPFEFRDAVLVESWSNDVWVNEEFVLRVCWKGDRDRLLREHQILSALPNSVPHAVVMASGHAGDLTWMLLERIQGDRLDVVWPSLSSDAHRSAVTDLGKVLGNLHDWVPPLELQEMLQRPTQTLTASRGDVVGSSILPLPVERVNVLLDSFEGAPGVSDDLLRRVRRRIDIVASAVDPAEFQDGPVVHGDAHFANTLWSENRVVALLDFEWARLGPPDMELEAACREDPVIEAASTLGPILASDVPMLSWLREGYPALFDRDGLTERLWLYDLCYQVRRLSIAGVVALEPLQLNRLRRLADQPRVLFA